MRVEEIIGIVKNYFFLALIAIIVLGIIFLLLYFIVYKKLLGGKKSLSKTRLLLVGLFISYVLMVIGVTFMNRGSNFQGEMVLSLFSSYREAWYSFSTRQWQFVLLNIFMFVPFGFLFPLLNARFQKALWTVGMAVLFTLSIECIQLLTGYGIFELDDLFNNLVGAIIGYGIIMAFISIKKKKIKQFLFFISPLFIVVFLFGSMLVYYNVKEFGNLPIRPSQILDMTQATTTIDIKLSDTRIAVPVYKAPSYTKDTADEFVLKYFKKLNIDVSNMDDMSYPDLGVYRVQGEETYNLSFQFLDGSYSYTDFSSFDEHIKPKDVEEETLKNKLTGFGIEIPPNAQFKKVNKGTFEWSVDKKIIENQLMDGTITVNYYNDDTVKGIDHHLITYEKVKDIQIKSEQEAYQELLDGKFNYYAENKSIKTLAIHNVELSFYLDSKSYYQPVYAFYSTVDGKDITILIPAI